MLDVHTRPKSKALFDRLRDHILEGRYFPGQWLKQAELEAAYNATRSDVRAALSSLSERGVVEYVKNQGFRVFSRSDEEIAEITEMIAILERAAVPKIIANITDDGIDELEELARTFHELITSGSHADLRLANYHIHNRLNSFCGSKLLMQTVQHLRECCISGPFERYSTFAGLTESSREHFAILKALRDRDAAEFERLIGEHSTQSLTR
ncbi:MAG: GntR family transcriptional regulator [Sphingobium sp.]